MGMRSMMMTRALRGMVEVGRTGAEARDVRAALSRRSITQWRSAVLRLTRSCRRFIQKGGREECVRERGGVRLTWSALGI